MTHTEALDLAITALRDQAESLKLHTRSVEILGDRAPRSSRRAAQQRAQLLEAVGLLTKMKGDQQNQ